MIILYYIPVSHQRLADHVKKIGRRIEKIVNEYFKIDSYYHFQEPTYFEVKISIKILRKK